MSTMSSFGLCSGEECDEEIRVGASNMNEAGEWGQICPSGALVLTCS